MVTKEQAMVGRYFEHLTLKNADGTPVRCRASGMCKTWKTMPNKFKLPVKHGLKDCFYITEDNADEWIHVYPAS